MENKMSIDDIKQQLINIGWSVNMDMLEGQRMKEITKELLDRDLQQCGDKFLPDMGELDQTTRPYIVQLHETRNVASSKGKKSSVKRPHLYRLMITDGHVFQNALVLPSLKNFNLDTPPGTKLLLKPQTKISNGFYLLNDQTCEVLGGTVIELVQKKLMNKSGQTLMDNESPPPPWVPYGSQHTEVTTVDISQRSMDVVKKHRSIEKDPDFARLRRAMVISLETNKMSKWRRFSKQNVRNGPNVLKAFKKASRQKPVKRLTKASSSAPRKTKTQRVKNQVVDEPIEDKKQRPQTVRKKATKRNDKPIEDEKQRAPAARKKATKSNDKPNQGDHCKRTQRVAKKNVQIKK